LGKNLHKVIEFSVYVAAMLFVCRYWPSAWRRFTWWKLASLMFS